MFSNTVFQQKSKISTIFLASLMLFATTLSFGANSGGGEKQSTNKIAFVASGFKSIISGAYFSPAATFTVNSDGDSVDAVPGNGVCADEAGNCTLRAAIQEANASPGTDSITFAITNLPATIQLSSTLTPATLNITEAVNISGPGARLLTISGNSQTTDGIFSVSSAVTTQTSISGMTIVKSGGHGINNDGRLSLTDVSIKTNRIGINNSGRLTINRAAISSNSGGGIYLAASSTLVNISNATITSNSSPTSGGGISSLSSDVTLTNVTISHNSAQTSGGGIYYSNTAAGFNLRNTIVANNTATTGPDVLAANNNGKFVSRGNNLIGKSAANIGFTDGTNGDKVGTLTTGIDPLLGPMQNNGGATDSRALLSGSPALDAGNMCVISSSCTPNPPAAVLNTDQRGTDFPRIYDGNNDNTAAVDIGAFEAFYPMATITSFVPTNWGATRGAFELVINGTNFVAGSQVKWNGQSRTTIFVSNTQIKAQIEANDTATVGQFPITVVNPTPGGGTSEPLSFSVVNCSYSINPTAQTFTLAGGNGNFSVTATNGCSWTAVTNGVPWLSIANGTETGSGNGTVSFTVAPNVGPNRNATITVGGKTFNISQQSGCTYSISPTSANNVPVAGVTGNITVMPSSSACTWTAVPSASWITVSNASGTSSGTFTYTVAPNSGMARIGSINVNGETFNISQLSGCSYSISSTGSDVPATASNGNFNVTTVTGCTWTATSSQPWVKINSGASGSGNGSVLFSVEANTGPARTATITVDNKTYSIRQAEGCTFTLSSTSANALAAGETKTVNVTASSNGCSWTSAVASNVSWITITSGASGTGNGTVQLTVAPNTGAARTGTLTIAGQTYTINQVSGCTFTLSPTGANGILAAGETRSISLTTPNNGCTWTAISNQQWITVSPQSGTGSGTLNFTVASNTGPARNGTITVGETTFSISQLSGCSITLSATNKDVTAPAGNGNFEVTAGAGCTWTAVSDQPWLRINSGASGSGNGSVLFAFDANNGPARTAKITVNGQTFTVVQASGCTFTLSSTSASNVSAAGAQLSVTVTPNNAVCSWTSAVASNVSWITITSGASGTGNGTVQLTVAPNTGAARTGTLTIAGQTYTINQVSGCAITLSSTGTTFDSTGGTGTINVTTNDQGCTWTATTNVPWITIDSGSPGTGNGTLTYKVLANVTPQREGKIIINGKEFIVTQRDGCSFSLSATASSLIAAAGGTGSFTVNAGAGCTWTAASNASWITVTSPASNNGSGTVNFTVAANNGPERIGTITAGGKTFEVKQASGCTFTLNPTGASNVPVAGASVTVAVTTSNAGCAWTSTVASNSSWITISGAPGATGNGSVVLTIAANTGPARTGTVTIANQTFTVTQLNGCVYSLNPTGVNINENGGDRSFNISAGAGCTWTATSNVPWITILSSSEGSGNGTINYRVAANTGDERIGTITAGGRTFTVKQLNLIVSNLNDDGPGSLRRAVANAIDSPGDDVVTFQPTIAGTIFLTSGEIKLDSGNGAIEIKGLGADIVKISGSNSSRIFYIDKSDVTISDLTLTGGNGVGKNSTDTARYGGAIYANGGSLLLNRVQIFSNTITVPNSPLSKSVGGGIYLQDGTNYSIQNSTIFLNKAASGAGLFNQGELTIVNSTIALNTASTEGGGIYTVGNTVLRNSTITNNSSPETTKGGGVLIWGGILNIGNSIIAGNSGSEISFISGSVDSSDYNLIGDEPGDSGNTISRILYQPNDILDTKPMFAVLENYGGRTYTAALLPNSPAINAGNNNNAPATDQRGAPRIVEDRIDIGAYEYNIKVSPLNSALPDSAANSFYSQRFGAERIGAINSTETFRFVVIDGYLPDGVTLTDGNGLLQGTPTVEGNYTFTVRALGDDGMAGANKYTVAVGCNYSINPVNASAVIAGGNGTFNLTTATGCTWTAVSNVPWITIPTAAASGNGNGSVSYTVAANTGAARSGTITAGGKTFTVNQAGQCNYTLSAQSANVPNTTGTTSFSINTGTGCSWTISNVASWMSIAGATTGTGTATITINVSANGGAARNGTLSIAGKTFTVNQAGQSTIVPQPVKFDFDGDRKSDVSVYRESTGMWHLQTSQAGYMGVPFGKANDKLAPADYDGDGKTDLAVFREDPTNSNLAFFHIVKSSDNTVRTVQFGKSGDSPLAVGDWDGDGKADISVYREGTSANPQGYFYYQPSSQPDVSFISFPWGSPGDKPAVADFDGDGKIDPSVFRPSTGVWYIQRSRDGFYAIQFGAPEDKAVMADYDGDGLADQAVFRPSNGVWYIWGSSAGFYAAQFGISTDIPVPGDFDGDKKTDMAVYRDGSWFILNSTNGFAALGFGLSSDKPIPNSYIP